MKKIIEFKKSINLTNQKLTLKFSKQLGIKLSYVFIHLRLYIFIFH